MPPLAIASTNPALAPQVGPARLAHHDAKPGQAQLLPSGTRAAQDAVAHDLRNLLATVALHLETLQRLSGPSGAKAADAAHALLTRGATVCNCILDSAARNDGRARRRGVDLMQVARHVADLLGSTAPKDFCFDFGSGGAVSVFADPDEAFRMLFNLMSNAVAVARREPTALRTVKIEVAVEGSIATMQTADDGPGLSNAARAGLFTRPAAEARHGYGLAIARELAERNGGTLTLATSSQGTTFVLKLPAFLSVLAQKEAGRHESRHLGRRAMML
jgi:signal transduction histidine kinase